MRKETDRHTEHLESTITIWQPYTNESLTVHDATEVSTNMVQFITLLQEWSRRDIGNESQGPGHKISEENA